MKGHIRPGYVTLHFNTHVALRAHCHALLFSFITLCWLNEQIISDTSCFGWRKVRGVFEGNRPSASNSFRQRSVVCCESGCVFFMRSRRSGWVRAELYKKAEHSVEALSVVQLHHSVWHVSGFSAWRGSRLLISFGHFFCVFPQTASRRWGTTNLIVFTTYDTWSNFESVDYISFFS